MLQGCNCLAHHQIDRLTYFIIVFHVAPLTSLVLDLKSWTCVFVTDILVDHAYDDYFDVYFLCHVSIFSNFRCDCGNSKFVGLTCRLCPVSTLI